MVPHISGTSLSAQTRYAAGTREILENYLANKPIRDVRTWVTAARSDPSIHHSHVSA
jgi:formate dehydrogenase